MGAVGSPESGRAARPASTSDRTLSRAASLQPALRKLSVNTASSDAATMKLKGSCGTPTMV